MTKLAKGEFKLISCEVFEKLSKAADETALWNVMDSSRRGTKRKKSVRKTDKSDLSKVKNGDIVETVILSGRYKGIWVRAEGQDIDDDTIDLRVLHPKKWKVVEFALSVPKKFVRTVTVLDKDSYTIPLEFVMDDQIQYLSCNKKMRISNLKTTVSQLRGVEPNQLVFIHRGTPLFDN